MGEVQTDTAIVSVFFEGAEPKIGGILGFKAERIDKKHT